MDNDFATGYALGADANNNGNCNGNGMWGGDMWAFLIFAMMFGWGNGGWGGGFGGGAGAATLNGIATRGDIMEGFAFNDIQRGITGISQGICDSTYAVTGAITNGFSQAALARCQDNATLMQQLNNMSYQQQNCCCETKGAIKDLSCQLERVGCDIIQSTHNDTDRIIGWLSNQETQRLRDENQSLKFAASQAAQNAYITASQDAQTAEIIRRVAPTPVPAYQVPNPNGCGWNRNFGCDWDRGCGCGFAC